MAQEGTIRSPGEEKGVPRSVKSGLTCTCGPPAPGQPERQTRGIEGRFRMFSEKEIEYIKSQRIARIATVSSQLQPDVAPVGFEFDGRHFYIGGLQQERTLKYRNVVKGNARVALVIDDMESFNPPKPRGLKIHGIAEIEQRQGQSGEGKYLKVRPERYWSWGIEEEVFQDGKIVMKKERIE